MTVYNASVKSSNRCDLRHFLHFSVPHFFVTPQQQASAPPATTELKKFRSQLAGGVSGLTWDQPDHHGPFRLVGEKKGWKLLEIQMEMLEMRICIAIHFKSLEILDRDQMLRNSYGSRFKRHMTTQASGDCLMPTSSWISVQMDVTLLESTLSVHRIYIYIYIHMYI